MARRTAMVLGLAVSVGLLGGPGCSKRESATANPEASSAAATPPNKAAGATSDKAARPKPFKFIALSLWHRDIARYLTTTKDPEPLRRQAEQFMQAVQLGMLPHPEGPGYAQTAEMGKKLIEQGSRDPLLRIYYARAVADDRGPLAALQIAQEALNDWAPSGYPGEYRRVGTFLVFAQKRLSDSPAWAVRRNEVVSFTNAYAALTAKYPELRRVVFYELSPLLADDSDRGWEDAIAISEACGKQPNADPWLVHMLAGKACLATAWHHRGGDWAYKVKPENWKPFHENLHKAAMEFTAAWELHPENPEAASQMIAVAMAGEGEQSPQEWFEKAVAAEMDYMPAYGRLRCALQPRWGGSADEMYRFGCRCADTRRYDTEVPYLLVNVVQDIDADAGGDRAIWRRNGVYPKVKQVLEGLANEPLRADGVGLLPSRSSVRTIHVAVAECAEQYAEARRIYEELGDRFDRHMFDLCCSHPEFTLTKIHLLTGKGADSIRKAWKTRNDAPRPFTTQTLQTLKGLYQEALAADGQERSKAYCRCWINEMDGRLAYGEGKWFEKEFDAGMNGWVMGGGIWSMENPRTAVGRVHYGVSSVCVRPDLVPMWPLEVEFDVGTSVSATIPVTLGLFLPEAHDEGLVKETSDWFFVRQGDNVAGIAIRGKTKTAACPLKPVNRLRVQLAEGHAALYVNDVFRVAIDDDDFHPLPAYNVGSHEFLPPSDVVRISNMRFRKGEPPKKKPASKEVKKDNGTAKEKPGPDKMARLTAARPSFRSGGGSSAASPTR